MSGKFDVFRVQTTDIIFFFRGLYISARHLANEPDSAVADIVAPNKLVVLRYPN